MNARRFWLFAIITCLFFLGLVFQTSRYTALKANVLSLQRMEMDLLKTGKELDANIAKLANMERIEKAALQNGMQIAAPEQRIIVTDIQAGQGNAQKGSSNGRQ
jgi:cell division protein FtsL